MRKKSGNGSTPTVRNTGLPGRCPATTPRMCSSAANGAMSRRRSGRAGFAWLTAENGSGTNPGCGWRTPADGRRGGGPKLETRRALGSGLPDWDLLFVLACLQRLRQRDRQHAILEIRLDSVGVDPLRDAERTLERAVAALRQMKILFLLLPF